MNDNLGVTSCTVLTAEADPAVKHLHHRMPIILNKSEFDDWLKIVTSVDDARQLLLNNRGSELVSYQVDRAVNSSRVEGENLIVAISG